ncbi:DUF3156 family protein [Pseudomonas sp. 3A(2025)]
MLSRLFDGLNAERDPSGYRPGVTLEHLRRNLGVSGWQVVEPRTARLNVPGLSCEVRERTESQLLMHLVMSEFVLRVPGQTRCSGRYDMHHTGSIRRTGLRCRHRGGDDSLLLALRQALELDEPLRAALMPLDFKRLRLEVSEGQWIVHLEHMGGSEVVNRMPAFRRYISIAGEQKAALFSALIALQRVLGQL